MCAIKQVNDIKQLTTTNYVLASFPSAIHIQGRQPAALATSWCKITILQRFACKVVITQPGTENANTGTNKQTNIGTSTHKKKNILILTFPSCPCLCPSLADGLKKSARPWHCSVHQFIAPDWNICRKENCIDITTNEQILCATMA